MNTSNDADARLGRNLSAGVASTAWTAIVTIGTVPVYLHFLGVEAYGLIGFYVALQAMFAVLDLGLSQAINREVARSEKIESKLVTRNLLRTLAAGYWFVAILIASGMWAASDWISDRWLSSTIDGAELQSVIALMGLTIALRFPLGLYLGVLIGARRIALASSIEIAMVTLANFGAIAILAFAYPTIEAFFAWQAAVAALNVAIVRSAAWRTLDGPDFKAPKFDLATLQRIWKFSAGVAVTAIVGAVFVQADKIVLSKIVSLEDLGRYTLAWIAARSLYVLTAPTFNAIYPQMSSMHAANRFEEIETIYLLGARILMAIIFPVAVYVSVHSTLIFALWTGSTTLTPDLPLVVTLLLFGTALNCAMHFPYAVQLAFGKSDLPMKINSALLLIFLPLLVIMSMRFGIAGGAAAWAILNTIYLFFGLWLTHRAIMPGAGLRWLMGSVGLPMGIALVIVGGGAAAIMTAGFPSNLGAVAGLALLPLSFAITMLLSPGAMDLIRQFSFVRESNRGAGA